MNRDKLFEKFNSKTFLKDEKILLVSHDDMDGYGPEILLRKAFKNLDVLHVSNKDMDLAILNTLERANQYDHIFITDISCSQQTADEIVASEYLDKYILLDHHKTATIAEYPFCVIPLENPVDSFSARFYSEKNTTGTPSGTSLTLDFLYHFNLLDEDKFAEEIAFTIEAFDTWDWKNVFGNYDIAFRLSQLFWAIGGERFVKGFATKTTLFSDTDTLILEIEDEKIETYCKTHKSRVIEFVQTIDGKSYECAYAFSTSYHTNFFSYMEKEFPNKDIYIIDDGTTYSFRTRKDDVDVSVIAKKLGGGGHTQAAGAPHDTIVHFEQFKSLF